MFLFHFFLYQTNKKNIYICVRICKTQKKTRHLYLLDCHDTQNIQTNN